MSRVLQCPNTACQQPTLNGHATVDPIITPPPPTLDWTPHRKQCAPTKRSNLHNDASHKETTSRTPSSPIQQGRSWFSPRDRTRGRERCKISSVRPSTRKQHPLVLSSPAKSRTFVRRNCIPTSGIAPRTHPLVDLELPILTSRPEHDRSTDISAPRAAVRSTTHTSHGPGRAQIWPAPPVAAAAHPPEARQRGVASNLHHNAPQPARHPPARTGSDLAGPQQPPPQPCLVASPSRARSPHQASLGAPRADGLHPHHHAGLS